MSTREKIASMVEDALFLDPPYFDDAILGIAERADGLLAVAYDRQRVIELIKLHSSVMDEFDAEEFYEFNTVGSWVGDRTPVFIDTRWAE